VTLAGLAKDVAELLREMQHSEAQPPHESEILKVFLPESIVRQEIVILASPAEDAAELLWGLPTIWHLLTESKQFGRIKTSMFTAQAAEIVILASLGKGRGGAAMGESGLTSIVVFAGTFWPNYCCV